jgi:hypothetical protein
VPQPLLISQFVLRRGAGHQGWGVSLFLVNSLALGAKIEIGRAAEHTYPVSDRD